MWVNNNFLHEKVVKNPSSNYGPLPYQGNTLSTELFWATQASEFFTISN